jgi:hypothetical protein
LTLFTSLIKLIPIYIIAKLPPINLALRLSLLQFIEPMLCATIRRVLWERFPLLYLVGKAEAVYAKGRKHE